MNKFLKSLLKIGLIRKQEDHTVRNAMSFAAGIGLGIGVGILLAPASGEETRSSIAKKSKAWAREFATASPPK